MRFFVVLPVPAKPKLAGVEVDGQTCYPRHIPGDELPEREVVDALSATLVLPSLYKGRVRRSRASHSAGRLWFGQRLLPPRPGASAQCFRKSSHEVEDRNPPRPHGDSDHLLLAHLAQLFDPCLALPRFEIAPCSCGVLRTNVIQPLSRRAVPRI